ncbi:MAG: AraC family transcriptional regulator ligand-binding domain-containing protein [Pseudomonadales bacterium]
MNPIEFTPKLSPRFIVYVRNYLLDCNIDPTPVFEHCGVNDVTDSEHAVPLPTQKLIELIDHAAVASEDSLLGFNMATHFHYESSALVVLAMLAAPNVAVALKTLSHFDRYVDTGITTSYEFGNERSVFRAELLGVDSTLTSHLNEYLLAFTVHALNTATRQQMPITEVHFQHQREGGIEELETFFGCKIKFAQKNNRLFFASSFLKEPLFTGNELLFEILQNALKTYFYAESREMGFVDSVCRELIISAERHDEESINSKTDTLEHVAEKLAMSTRTLRRRLKDEGYTFQEVKNLARERQAKHFLGNTRMTLAEIAYSIGFSELSAFSRAFKRWTGNTPQEYRTTVRKLITA